MGGTDVFKILIGDLTITAKKFYVLSLLFNNSFNIRSDEIPYALCSQEILNSESSCQDFKEPLTVC